MHGKWFRLIKAIRKRLPVYLQPFKSDLFCFPNLFCQPGVWHTPVILRLGGLIERMA